MSFKSLFFTDANEPAEKTTKTAEPAKFPTATPVTFPTSTAPTPTPVANIPLESNPSCAPHMTKIMEMYEKGFESLNKPGYDFFEYFKSVVSAGADNPAVYPMAFSMATAMDASVTKEALLNHSDFYVTEITKVYNDYVSKGNTKKQSILAEKDSENLSLSTDLQTLESQLTIIQNQITETKLKLTNINIKYEPQITEVDCKLMANNVAKDKIINSINKVRNGINTNIN